jgi:hypothetical protein
MPSATRRSKSMASALAIKSRFDRGQLLIPMHHGYPQAEWSRLESTDRCPVKSAAATPAMPARTGHIIDLVGCRREIVARNAAVGI